MKNMSAGKLSFVNINSDGESENEIDGARISAAPTPDETTTSKRTLEITPSKEKTRYDVRVHFLYAWIVQCYFRSALEPPVLGRCLAECFHSTLMKL